VKKRQSKVFCFRVIASTALITIVGTSCHFVSKPLVLRNRPNVPPPTLAPSNRTRANQTPVVKNSLQLTKPTVPKIVNENVEKVEIIKLDNPKFTPTTNSDKPILAPDIRTAPLTHTIQKGDSFWKIARQYGVSKNELAACNNMPLDQVLKVGSVLVIPPGGMQGYNPPPIKKHYDYKKKSRSNFKSARREYKRPPKFSYKKPVVSSNITSTGKYTVQAGDSLWKIARRTGTTTSALASLNNLDKNSTLKVGAKLIIPSKKSNSRLKNYKKTYSPKSIPKPVKKTVISTKSPTRKAPQKSTIKSTQKSNTPVSKTQKKKNLDKLDSLLNDAEKSVDSNNSTADDLFNSDNDDLLNSDSDELIEDAVDAVNSTKPGDAYYREQVLPDETLEEIAERNAITVEDILKINPQIKKDRKIEPFSFINLPK